MLIKSLKKKQLDKISIFVYLFIDFDNKLEYKNSIWIAKNCWRTKQHQPVVTRRFQRLRMIDTRVVRVLIFPLTAHLAALDKVLTFFRRLLSISRYKTNFVWLINLKKKNIEKYNSGTKAHVLSGEIAKIPEIEWRLVEWLEGLICDISQPGLEINYGYARKEETR